MKTLFWNRMRAGLMLALVIFSVMAAAPQQASASRDVLDRSQAGTMFVASLQSGVTTTAGLSATQVGLTIHNPAGSNKDIVIHEARWSATVAFAAASVIWLAISPIEAAPTSTTAATVRCTRVGNSANPTANCYRAATLASVPVAGPILGVGLTGAITTTPWINVGGRIFNDEVVVAPGASVSIQTSTASGASGMFQEIIFEERAQVYAPTP